MELSLLIVIALVVGVLFLLWRYPAPGSIRAGKSRASVSPGVPGVENRVRGQTQRQLVRMVGGNRAVAERLVEQVRVRYPNHNEQWCWEKAIYDIQRDRRS